MIKLRKISLGVLLPLIALSGCGSNEAEDQDAMPVESVDAGDVQDAPEGTEEEKVKAPAKQLNVGENILNSPTDFQMAVTFFQVIGLEPPLKEWASKDRRVTRANEFDRNEASARVEQELSLAAQAVADVGYVTINTDSSFGEYDMESQGFYLNAISSDKFWTWRYDDTRVRLTMENGNRAKLWKIPADEARNLVENLRSRNVDINLKIKIIGAIPEGNGGVLNGKITGYEVFNRNREGVKYGAMTFQ